MYIYIYICIHIHTYIHSSSCSSSGSARGSGRRTGAAQLRGKRGICCLWSISELRLWTFSRFASSILLILRGGIPRFIGNSPYAWSRLFLACGELSLRIDRRPTGTQSFSRRQFWEARLCGTERRFWHSLEGYIPVKLGSHQSSRCRK